MPGENKIEIQLIDGSSPGGAPAPSPGKASARIPWDNEALGKMFGIDLTNNPAKNAAAYKPFGTVGGGSATESAGGVVSTSEGTFGNKMIDWFKNTGLKKLGPVGEAAASAESGLGRFGSMLGKVAVPLGALTVAIGAVATVSQLWGKQMMTEATNVGGGGNRGRMQRINQLNADVGSLQGYGGTLVTLGLYDLWKYVSRVKEKSQMEAGDIFRATSERLAGFDPTLAGAMAQRQVGEVSRDIQEARAIGRFMAGVEKQQQQLDLIRQQIEAAKFIRDAAKQMKDTQNRIDVNLKDLADVMKELTPEQQKKIRDMEKRPPNPIQELLDNHGFRRQPMDRDDPKIGKPRMAPLGVGGIFFPAQGG